MKKIVYLSDVSLDIVGGAQESMKIIMNGLEKEFEFHMITPSSSKKVKNQIILDNYTNFVLKGKTKGELMKLLFEIRSEINKIKPDIIHVQMPSTMILVNILKTFRLISSKIKLIYTDRGVLDKYGNMTQKLIKRFSKNFTYIVTTTYNNRKIYKKNNIGNEEKLIVIPNTAGDLFDTYDPNVRVKIREQYNVLDDEIVIGFSGRYSPDKNWPLAVEIIKELEKRYKFKVVITIGTDRSEKEEQEVNAIIKQLEDLIGKEQLIALINVPIEKMNEIFYLSDIFILTSIKESFGRTAVEAMARKNVAYGTRIDGLEEVIHFEENKYTLVEELIKKMEENLISPEKLNHEKIKFYNHYLNNYNTKKCLNSHKEMYDSLF